MVTTTDFFRGMETGGAKSRAAAKRGENGKVFDWDKAAKIIRERKPEVVEAGLQEDWGNTAGEIFEDGEIVENYTYLFSMWATPILRLNRSEEIQCFVECTDEANPNKWGSGTYWPDSARELVKE